MEPVNGQIESNVVWHNGSVVSLKYFFTAFYNDGTYFNQHPDDTSILLPEEERVGKSSFSDVDKSKLVGFGLTSEKSTVIVDLITGRFHVNGLEFQVGRDVPTDLGSRQLIFDREHEHDINKVSLEEVDHRVRYRLGWQATSLDGQRTVVKELFLY